MRKLSDISVKNKTVALRADLNVPVKEGIILDDARIEAVIPTVKYLLTQNCKIILISHFGRPKAGTFDPEASLQPIASRIGEMLNRKVDFISAIEDVKFKSTISLLENTRFLIGELENNEELSKNLGSMAEVYVFDAFGTSHREQASTFGAIHQANVSCAGLLLEAEIEALTKATHSNDRPLLSIVGGSKVSTKLEVLKNLSQFSDHIITGGGITNTFLKAQGFNIGKSLHEESMLDEARQLLGKSSIHLPSKVVVAPSIDSLEHRICSIESVQDHEMILDQCIDSDSLELIANAKQIIWNGPMGVFEKDNFSEGTQDLAKAIAASSAFSLAGGGETLLAIKLFINKGDISYCSTGGGAFLEFMEGKELPSLTALGFIK
jgi:phosphoglycerate kinase